MVINFTKKLNEVTQSKIAHKILKNHNFIEVYIKCSLEVCETRDVKGMYKKARSNEINNFIGIHVNYEPPTNPQLIVDTENSPIDNSMQIILDYLNENKIIKNPA